MNVFTNQVTLCANVKISNYQPCEAYRISIMQFSGYISNRSHTKSSYLFFLTELRIVCTFAGKLFRSNPLGIVDTSKSCRLCKRIFPSVRDLKEHVESFSHHFNLDCDDLFPLEYVLQQVHSF